PSQIAGRLADDIPCPADWDRDDFEALRPMDRLMLWTCGQALRDAGWWEQREQLRIGLVFGVGGELLEAWEADGLKGGRRIHEPWRETESLVQRTQRRLGLRGPCACVSAACASGNYAIGQARRWLELDWVDVCLAGACD